jgi:O-antigen ligase
VRWLATPDASQFLFVVFAVLVMGTSLVLTGSRSGMAAFVVAALVLSAVMARRASGAMRRGMVVAYGATIVAGALLWAGLSTVVSRFTLATVDLATRLSAWRDTLRIVEDFPLAGTGLGTYDLAMLVYQTAHRSTMFAQAHNDYLQIVAEGGALVAIPAAACVLTIAGTVRRRFREQADDPSTYWLRVGALAAIAGIAAQSLVEFSLQMPANALLFVVVLAVALRRPPRVESHAHRV